jgi:hypothetical protein
MSATIEVDGAAVRLSGCASSSVAKLKRNVSASMPNAAAGLTNATTSPPMVGPAIRAALRLSSRAAFPARRMSAGTSSAMIALNAGDRKASAAPRAAAAT